MADLKAVGKLTKVIEASFIAFIAITALGIYDFIIPLFTENFAASLAVIGTIISAGYVMSFIIEVPIGKLVDKYGRVIVLLLALASLGIIGLLFYFAQNVWQVAAFVMLFGFAQIMFWVPSTVFDKRLFP